jgi:hypothetical protein
MDFNRIETLLERYNAGETTLAEEKELRQAFQDEALAQRYPAAAQWFGYQVAAKKRRLRPAAARATQRRISGTAAPRRTLAVSWVLRIAAALLIGIAAFQWLARDPAVTGFPVAETETTVDWSKYEVTDPAEAARILSRSLRTMSGEMRSGLKTAGQEIRKVNSLTDPVAAGS